MNRNLEDQMRLSLRAILSKQMTRGGTNKHQVVASFVSDDSGFPLTGLKRNDESILEMEINEFEQMCAIIPQIWETTIPVSGGLKSFSGGGEVNHFVIGFKKKENDIPPLEMMVTRLDELFLSSIYFTKN
ncbi:MAG: hypothetical protein ACXAC8_12785 [Candidatus Hodarchaeales archaeon]|jgi:hypothetical protein